MKANGRGDGVFGMLIRHFASVGGHRRDRTGAPVDGASDALVQDIATGIYQAELRRGGWAADLGVFGPELFVGEAAACLRAIELGTDESGPPSP
jgi:hypothetical protein